MAFKKGHKKFGGKSQGTPNKTTKQAKEHLESIMYGQLDNITEALGLLFKEDPGKYLDTCSRLFAYVLPKKTDITSDDGSLKPVLNITFQRK